MDYRTGCSIAVAAAVLSWPIDLCRIVADYAAYNVRWSAGTNYTERSADGSECQVVGCFGDFESSIADRFNHLNYVRIVAESPISISQTYWTLKFTVDGYYARIGILKGDGSPLLTTPTILFSSDVSVFLSDESIDFDTVAIKSTYVRFCVSADLITGRFAVRVRTPSKSIDWFSATVPPVLLAASVPVVYLRGSSSSVQLVDD